jgi:integrase-like protein
VLRLGEWIDGSFVPFAEALADGGHISTSSADARKGSFSNALKEAAAAFGAGRQAYVGHHRRRRAPGRAAPAGPAAGDAPGGAPRRSPEAGGFGGPAVAQHPARPAHQQAARHRREGHRLHPYPRQAKRWPNVRRDLSAACRRAGIAKVTPNDLRRTFASWLLQAGESNFVVAKMMGHSSTKMVETIYGQLGDPRFAEAAGRFPALTLPAPAAGSASVAEPAPLQRSGRAGRITASGSTSTEEGEDRRPRENLRSGGAEMFERDVVPGPGIEPGTRGFSVLVGEWPRPREPLEKRRARGATEAELCQGDAGSGQMDLPLNAR